MTRFPYPRIAGRAYHRQKSKSEGPTMNKTTSVRRFVAVLVVSFIALGASAQARQPRRLVLCLDGTWNSTFSENVRVDGSKVLRPSARRGTATRVSFGR